MTDKTEPEGAQHLYGSKKKSNPISVKIGVLVRINKTKISFDKGYLPNWTSELFKGIKIHMSSPQLVQLVDFCGENSEG